MQERREEGGGLESRFNRLIVLLAIGSESDSSRYTSWSARRLRDDFEGYKTRPELLFGALVLINLKLEK